jgi:hypothetical protein
VKIPSGIKPPLAQYDTRRWVVDQFFTEGCEGYFVDVAKYQF